jgi:hypothetical protein
MVEIPRTRINGQFGHGEEFSADSIATLHLRSSKFFEVGVEGFRPVNIIYIMYVYIIYIYIYNLYIYMHIIYIYTYYVYIYIMGVSQNRWFITENPCKLDDN